MNGMKVTQPRSQIRRRDRAIEDEAWIRMFLHQAPFGVLATVSDGQPFINSNLFVYDEAAHVIYTRTAPVGRTRANIMENERVCFSVSEIGRILPADAAVDFSVEYAGVVVFGSGSLLQDVSLARGALQQLLGKYAPHQASYGMRF